MHFPTLLLAALLSFATPVLPASDIVLPDIGDSSATVLPPEKARQIGQNMLQQFRQAGLLIEDSESARYIQSLGYRLISAGEGRAENFTFFLVKDPSINAFAMPGGFIGVHTGLILASRTESELAAVMAHEIAHVTQRHLERGLEASNRYSLPLTAAAIAAILLSGGDSQVAEAAIASSMAASSQMQLNYSRLHEQEADRVGMQLLVHAEFDPSGMPGFFTRLQQEYRYQETALPEYLSTHPITVSRISDAQNRAVQYPNQETRNDPDYHITKARLRVATSRDIDTLTRHIENNLKTGRYDNENAERFAYALALQQGNKHAQAKTILDELYHQHPNRIPFRLALAQSLQQLDQGKASHALYREGLELYPTNLALTLAYSHFLLQTNEAGEAQRLLKNLLNQKPENSSAYSLLAKAEQALGNTAASQLALADYYYHRGQFHAAVDQLQLAKRSHDKNDFYLNALIDAKLRQYRQALPADKPRQQQKRRPH